MLLEAAENQYESTGDQAETERLQVDVGPVGGQRASAGWMENSRKDLLGYDAFFLCFVSMFLVQESRPQQPFPIPPHTRVPSLRLPEHP